MLPFHSPVFAAEAAKTNAPWSYDSATSSQDNWGALSPAYAACDIGTQQSPIDISLTEKTLLPPLDLRYGDAPVDVIHTEHGLRLNIKGGLSLVENNVTYALTHIEFHSPGEHTFKQEYYPLEIQFFHQDMQGHQLVLAVVAKKGLEAPSLSAVLMQTPKEVRAGGTVLLNPLDWVPQYHGYYAYTGSLTYPPCTEGVEWRVLKYPITVSDQQLATIGRILGRNSRLTQAIYMRTVKESNR